MWIKVVHFYLRPSSEEACACAAHATTASTLLIDFIVQINSAPDGQIDQELDQAWANYGPKGPYVARKSF